MNPSQTPKLPFFLGCPVFNCDGWKHLVYPPRTPSQHRLRWYSQMFNTVEGNSTFYGLPSIESVQRWCAESANGFRFSLKFPRLISHDHELLGCQTDLSAFLEIVQQLDHADRLGPTFLQLGPAFGPDKAKRLTSFLDDLPAHLPWAVEVRHHDWFDSGTHEQSLNDALRERSIDKVLFDSRPLYQSPPEDEIEAASQQRKPKTPVRQTVTGSRPLLRLVGRNRLDPVHKYVTQWTRIVTRWVTQGYQPFIFTHAPDDRFAPAFARLFWDRFCAEMRTADPESSWKPSDLPSLPPAAEQPNLFEME